MTAESETAKVHAENASIAPPPMLRVISRQCRPSTLKLLAVAGCLILLVQFAVFGSERRVSPSDDYIDEYIDSGGNDTISRRVFNAASRRGSRLPPMIIVITPTYRRNTRMADMTRMSNTLRQVPHLHWIVIEDGLQRVSMVEALLNRTGLPYTYIPAKTKEGYPKRGWWQRDQALTYLRKNWRKVLGEHKKGVVYFGDDDNAYDLRLFNDYIRRVDKAGVWAVGLVGGTVVEAPHVENGRVVSWDVSWNPRRKFATDMAGFAIGLDVVILHPNALFGTSCKRGGGAPETCILEDHGLQISDLQAFGLDQPRNRELLVWHTKTVNPKFNKAKVNTFGFNIE